MYFLYLTLLASIGLVVVAALADVLGSLAMLARWRHAADAVARRKAASTEAVDLATPSEGGNTALNDDAWRLTA